MTFRQFLTCITAFLCVLIVFCMMLAAFPVSAANKCPYSLDYLIERLEKIEIEGKLGTYWINQSNAEHRITVVHVVWERHPYAAGFVFLNGCRQWSQLQLDADTVLKQFGLPPRSEYFAKTY